MTAHYSRLDSRRKRKLSSGTATTWLGSQFVDTRVKVPNAKLLKPKEEPAELPETPLSEALTQPGEPWL